MFKAALVVGLLCAVAATAAADRAVSISGNLHAAPMTTASVVDHLAAGTAVAYVLKRGSWLAIRRGNGLAWVQVLEAPDEELGSRDPERCWAGDHVDVGDGDRVEVVKTTHLRGRFDRERDIDRVLERGAQVSVRATDRESDWVLVETGGERLGWLRRCEIEQGRVGAAGDEVVVLRSGDLLATPKVGSKKVMRIRRGARVTVAERVKDWAQLMVDDGVVGWYPIKSLEWHAADDGDPDDLWQAGLRGVLRCGGQGAARDRGTVRCGEELRVIRASGDRRHPVLLVADEKWLAVCSSGYFMVTRANGTQLDLYDGVLGQTTGDPVTTLNSTGNESSTYLSPDCLTVLFASTRSGTMQMYAAQRASITDAWPAPIMITAFGMSTDNEDAYMSPDQRLFVFASVRDGSAAGDKALYISTR